MLLILILVIFVINEFLWRYESLDIDFREIKFIPFLIYVFYFVFLFFPTKKLFLGGLRWFLIRKIRKCLAFGFIPTVFSIIFITD